MIYVLAVGFIALLIAYGIQYKTIKILKEKTEHFEQFAGGSVESENYYQDYDDRMKEIRAELGMDETLPTSETEILNPMLYGFDEIVEVKKFKKEVVK